MRSLIASKRRFVVVALSVVFCILAIIFRLWWLQIYSPGKYRAGAESVTHTQFTEYASRGNITDFRGEKLAYNHELWDIGVDPQNLADNDSELIPQFAKILNVPESELREKFEPQEITLFVKNKNGEVEERVRPRRWVVLKRDVDGETKNKILEMQPSRVTKNGKKMVRNSKPVYGQRKFVREYPNGQLAAQTIGFVNKEGVPAMGIEATMNEFLCGANGWRETVRDKKGRDLVHRRYREVPVKNGCTVELTIDARIQGYAERECEKIAQEYSPKSSCIIVSEARTGRILALANYPTFDLNEFYDPVKAPLENQKNRAVTDVYEPGSVFKIVPVAAALEERVVTPDTVFDCSLAAVPYRGKMLRMPKDSHAIGRASVREIVKESSNRGSAQIGMLLAERRGEECFYNYVLKFGFGRPTKLLSNRGGESSGIVHAPKDWDGLTITRFPMGHSVSVTALQIHDAMSVIANGGKFIEPQIVSRVLEEDGREILSYPPSSRGRVVSAATARTVAQMLRAVCGPGGTARRADVPGYEVGGKTGTTQKLVDGVYSSRHHVASFSGFFPVSNPKVIITVIVDEPKLRGVGYGGSVAAPVFKRVAEEVIKQMELQPVKPLFEN